MPHRLRRQNRASREAPRMGTGQGRASGAWQEKGTTREVVTNCHLDGRPSRATLFVVRVLWTLPPP